jgi:hypothetical protein
MPETVWTNLGKEKVLGLILNMADGLISCLRKPGVHYQISMIFEEFVKNF